jgi:DNA gyrase subunit A
MPAEALALEPPSEASGEEGTETRSAMYYRKQRRGGKGIRDVRTSERNGPVVGVLAVREGDDIMLITTGGMVIRMHVREIRVVGRNTQGVRVMGLRENDHMASLARIAPEAAENEVPAVPETPAAE